MATLRPAGFAVALSFCDGLIALQTEKKRLFRIRNSLYKQTCQPSLLKSCSMVDKWAFINSLTTALSL